MKLPIRTKVAVIISLIIVFFGVLTSFFVYYTTRKSSLDEKRQTLLTLVTERANALSKTMLIGEDVARLVSEAGLIKNFLADPKLAPDETMNRYLEHFNLRDEFSAIYLMTATGSAVASTDRTFIGNNYGFRNYFKDAISVGRGREVAIGVTSKQQGFYFSFPVKDGAGKILGVAIAKMRNAPFDEVIKSGESTKLGETLLVDDDGIILFSSKPEWIFKTLTQIGPERLADIKAERKFEGSPLTPLTYEKAFEAMLAYQSPMVLSIFDREENRDEILSLARINESNYFLILESGTSEVIRQSLMLSLAIAGFVLLTALVTNGLAVGFLERSLRPLDSLIKAVRQLGSGDFSANFSLKTGDEIEELGSVFNQMVAKLQDTYSDLSSFRRAVENVSSHIIITDPEAKIIYANPAASRITGYSNEEMVGNNPKLWGKQMGKEFYQKMWQQIKFEKIPFRSEVRNKRKNGEFYVAIMTISPILDEKNNLLGFVGLEDDITDRIRAEDALRVSEERFRLLIANSSDAIALLSKEGVYTFVSPSVVRVLGLPPENFINKGGLEFVHPEEHEKIKTTLSDLIENPETSVKFQVRMMHKDGTWHWIESIGTNGLAIPGINAIIVNYRDINDRKLVEQNLAGESRKLAEEKRKDEAILASIGEGVVVMDQSGKIILMNPEAGKLLGWRPDELVGKSYLDAWKVKDSLSNEVINRPAKRALESGEVFSSGDYLFTNREGGVFPVFITATPIIQEGKVTGAINVFRDITKEKTIERAKSEFVSLASHQLRTPLSAVNWYTEMLLSGDLGAVDPNQKKYLEEIYDANRRMVELVNALLNVSRIDLGTFAIEPEEIALDKLAKNIISELQPQIVYKKLQLGEHYDPLLPTIKADPKLTRIIIQNLLTNSVRYTPDGGKVDLDLKLVKSGTDIGNRKAAYDGILIKVADNGFGIPENVKEKVFAKLFRADNAKVRVPEGTGLGLYIVKSIVDAVSGSIWFDSVENQGTTFYVLLPLAGMPKKEGTKQLNYDTLGKVFV